MKIKYHKIKTLALLLFWVGIMMFACTMNSIAQSTTIKISSKIVDEEGNPLKNATIRIFNKQKVVHSNEEGAFEIKAETNNIIYISAQGFNSHKIDLNNEPINETISLVSALPYLTPEDQIQLPFAKLEKKRTIGAVSVVDGEDLLSYPDLSLLNALSGRVAGLYSLQKSSTPGWNAPTLSVRGISGSGINKPLILVDGLERDANSLLPEEIESIEVLKDISAKMLYGSRASDGVIVVTTKRGKNNTRDARVNVEYGIMMPTSDPQWLDAADYATMYNKARVNDGLSPLYSDEAINAYKNGTDPILYPNNDYHSMFLNNQMPIKRASTEFQGGGKSSAYYVNFGYTGTGGFEDIQEPTEYNKFNVRGNLDIQVTDITSVKMDVAGRMEYRRSANMTTQDFFGALSSHRPNEYPIFIPTDSTTLLGSSFMYAKNIYGMGNETSYKKQEDRNIQFNLGLDFNLNKYVDGLSASIYLSYDNESMYRYGLKDDYGTYAVLPADNENGYQLIQQKIDVPDQTKQTKIADSYNHRVGTISQINYSKLINDKHDIVASLVLQQHQEQILNQIQYDKFANYGLRINYMYNNKYIAELNTSLMGSSRFAKGNRFGLFPAIGLGWLLSEEDFLKESSLINYLKIKASGGVMGSDKGIGYYLYEDRYAQDKKVTFGEKNAYDHRVYQLHKYGNPDLTWEKSREINIGVEAILFNKSLSAEFNYFNILDYDLISAPSELHPSYIGSNLYNTNNGEIANRGFEGDIIYHNNSGAVKFSAGVNFVYSKSEIIKNTELNYPDDLNHMSKIGDSNDGIYGYVSDGLLTDADIANGYLSTLGEVKAGDIKYVDINKDGIIDNRDRKNIGNDFPSLSMGLHIDVKYKGFALYALGTLNSGFDVMKKNKYYWAHSSRKYSSEVMNSDYPRLSTTNSTNNFSESTYWLEDASFFKLKNVELSYTLPAQILSSLRMKNAKLFVRGTNLLTLSKFDDLDPENIDAGIDDYPLMKAVTGGISVTF
ncbi:SusC/RagA family TonB-linked outer membrane protein [Labilibacter sediminis]|nr:SusC/RagA family TonB-linked outer membrane protein [Labilibacter sediminis]